MINRYFSRDDSERDVPIGRVMTMSGHNSGAPQPQG